MGNPAKSVSMTRQQLLDGAPPEDTWEVNQCSPTEAVDLAMRLLGQTIQNLIQLNQAEIEYQSKLLQSVATNVPGARQYIEVYNSTQRMLVKTQ